MKIEETRMFLRLLAMCEVLRRVLLHHRLTLGLMGLDELHLRVLAASSDDITERSNASKGPMAGEYS